MNKSDIQVDILQSECNKQGMQLVMVQCGVRVTHLPTNIVVEIPHTVFRSQNKGLNLAMQMLDLAIGDINVSK